VRRVEEGPEAPEAPKGPEVVNVMEKALPGGVRMVCIAVSKLD